MIDRRALTLGILAAATYAALGAGRAEGSGFALMEQSAKELGSAFAGGAAAAEDAATIFFNPAGLSLLPGSQLVIGGHLLLPNAEFHNEGSRHGTGAPLTGDDGVNAVNTIAFPTVYYSHQLNDRVHLGLGIFSPFGLSTKYDTTWVGRYYAVNSELQTLTINPCLSYRINDQLSVGAGIDVQYVKAKLSNAIDFGTILSSLGVPGFVPQGNDGFATFKGDSWSWGGNVGVLYQFTPDTRAGVSYRSRIDHTVEGSADFSRVPAAATATGRFQHSDVSADLTLPDSVSLSLWHNFTKDVAATADFTWTHWTTFDELRIRFANPAESDAVITTQWRNTWRYSAGLVYTPGPWTFRTGAAYDPTPVPNAELRSPRIPDNDRIWITGGAGYRFSDSFSFDLGYAHLFVKDPVIAKTATGENALRGALKGTYKGEVDIVGAQIAYTF